MYILYKQSDCIVHSNIIDMTRNDTKYPRIKDKTNFSCDNCGTKNPGSQWRRSFCTGRYMCNACGLRSQRQYRNQINKLPKLKLFLDEFPEFKHLINTNEI